MSENPVHTDFRLEGAPPALTGGRGGTTPHPASSSRRAWPEFVRSVRPEFLDGLDADSPAARASRRDLRRINRLLRTNAWFTRVLRQHLRPGERVLEIGAGTGELGQAVRALTPHVAGLDLGGRPAGWPDGAPWFATDVHAFTGWSDYPVILANLFFHHFDNAGLARLGAALQAHARVIIASDPLRTRRTLALFRLLCPILRAHPITRYDGSVSIEAGFRHDELARRLQLDPARWHWHGEETWLGSSRLVAVQRA